MLSVRYPKFWTNDAPITVSCLQLERDYYPNAVPRRSADPVALYSDYEPTATLPRGESEKITEFPIVPFGAPGADTATAGSSGTLGFRQINIPTQSLHWAIKARNPVGLAPCIAFGYRTAIAGKTNYKYYATMGWLGPRARFHANPERAIQDWRNYMSERP